MVLKRLLVTTLSALGLGALAAGTASGQTAGEGNIPAPDVFDDQITCSMLVPSVGGMTALNTPSRLAANAMTSALDDLIGDGDVAVVDPGSLGYVIPPMGSNCGLGANGAMFGAMNVDANSDDDFLDAGDTIMGGSVPIDVAEGYSELLPLFEAVYGNPGQTTGGTARALAAANKALADAIEAGQTGTALTPLQNAITRAQEAHNMALARFNSAAGGPIYQAGVAEWMAKAAVTKSISDYNAQVVKTNAALVDLDGLDYGSYVPLGNNELITTVVTFTGTDNSMGTVDPEQLEQYINAVLGMSMVATVMDGVTNTEASNFALDGTLIVPMRYYEPDGTLSSDQTDPSADAVLRPLVVADGDANQIGDQGTGGQGIRAVVERTNAAAAALKKLRDDNVVTSVQSIYNDAYARAQAEADYYNAVWAEVLSDNTDLRTAQQKLQFVDDNSDGVNDATETTVNDTGADAYVENPITIAGRNAAYATESNKRFTAEQGLRAAVVARETATDAVRAAFTSPQSFYDQLVARRQAKKATADKNVADATADGGTAPKSLTDAQAAAAKALTDAEAARDNLVGLFADEDDPSVALLNELLKTGGDDGQALVDAISETYETAAGAADAAREVVNELTGEGGAVNTNTANIATNMSNIENNSNDIVALEEEVWDADGNSRIDANETRSTENRTMIMTNAGNIATNATNIAANTGLITGLRTDVDQNAADIETNAGNVMMNSGRIDTNAAAIGMNADAIASNMNSIGSNQSAISDNRNMIGELSDDLDVVRAGVAASMALAGMPAINGRGISIGVGSFDGESAFAVGFQIQGEMASFKVGVTSASGATGASAGVGFQF